MGWRYVFTVLLVLLQLYRAWIKGLPAPIKRQLKQSALARQVNLSAWADLGPKRTNPEMHHPGTDPKSRTTKF